MVSLKHRAMEWLVKRNPGDLLVRDLDELRALRLRRQDEAGQAPPPGLAQRVDLSSYEHEGMAVHVLAPSGVPTERTVFFLHGGGYVGHADPQHWRYAERLGAELSARVVMPAYPVAPRSTWRDAHPLVAGLFHEVADEGVGDLTLVGDSAGGGFALALAQQMVAESGPLPDRLVLVSAWVDMTPPDASLPDDPWISRDYLALCARLWAGDDPLTLPALSPLFSSLEGLPPILVLCGTKDVQLPQARALVAAAQAVGTPVTYVEEPGLLHDYPILNIPEARRALRQVAQFVRGESVKVAR
jgi:epsilon-lactone hydrolase